MRSGNSLSQHWTSVHSPTAWDGGYLWFSTPSLLRGIGAGTSTLSGAQRNASTSDLPCKHFHEEIGPYQNYSFAGGSAPTGSATTTESAKSPRYPPAAPVAHLATS